LGRWRGAGCAAALEGLDDDHAAAWPTSARIEALRAAWLDAADMDEQRRICAELQKQLWEDVPFIPMGEYWQATAYRSRLFGLDERGVLLRFVARL
jgi:peptide/nickel transport system substrate-binding protein